MTQHTISLPPSLLRRCNGRIMCEMTTPRLSQLVQPRNGCGTTSGLLISLSRVAIGTFTEYRKGGMSNACCTPSFFVSQVRTTLPILHKKVHDIACKKPKCYSMFHDFVLTISSTNVPPTSAERVVNKRFFPSFTHRLMTGFRVSYDSSHPAKHPQPMKDKNRTSVAHRNFCNDPQCLSAKIHGPTPENGVKVCN